jgi:hypothetical protein
MPCQLENPNMLEKCATALEFVIHVSSNAAALTCHVYVFKTAGAP